MLPEERPLLGSALAQYTSLTLRVFVSPSVNVGDYQLYEDDGQGMNYETEHNFAEFYYEKDQSSIQFTVRAEFGNFTSIASSDLF